MTAAASPSRRRTAAAESLAADKELGDRIDIFEHFVALGLYEPGGFGVEGRRKSVDVPVRPGAGLSGSLKPGLKNDRNCRQLAAGLDDRG